MADLNESLHWFDGDYWEADLRWSRPRAVDPGERVTLSPRAFEHGGLYRFERLHLRAAAPVIVRIGIAHAQSIGDRVGQYEPWKLDEWRRRGRLQVSFAPVDMEHQHRRQRYEEIEHLLVFLMQPEHNEKKRATLPSTRFRLRNLGSHGALPREIVFPLLYAGPARN
jgi:hypothetical protein